MNALPPDLAPDEGTHSSTTTSTDNPITPVSLADALARVRGWTQFDDHRRADLVSALNLVAKGMELPADAVAFSPAAIRGKFITRSAAWFNVSAGRLRNARSAVNFVLHALGLVAEEASPMSAAWAGLLDPLDNKTRLPFSRFARFCTEQQIEPLDVTDDHLEFFEAFLTERTICPTPRKFVSQLRGRWNHQSKNNPAWPRHQFEPLRTKGQFILPLDRFTPTFQADLDRFAACLAGNGAISGQSAWDDDEEDSEQPLTNHRPLRKSSIESRCRHLRTAASALVALGTPITELNTLSDLVQPVTRARDALKFMHNLKGGKPSAPASHASEALVMLAKHDVRLPAAEVERIKRWARTVALPPARMTEKNEALVKQAVSPARAAKLYALPKLLMQAAYRERPNNPKRAASYALRAASLGILLYLPIRLANLIGLRLDKHLWKPDSKQGRYEAIVIPAEETKNRRRIDLPIPAGTATLLEQWNKDFRGEFGGKGNLHLFPGQDRAEASITPQGMRDAIKDATKEHIGVALNPHSFRHVAANQFLASCPGHYEEVRQFLGHASIKTTTDFYAGIEQGASARRFDGIITVKQRHLRPAKQPKRSKP